MQELVRTINLIKQLPGANVDQSYGQGSEAVISQLLLRAPSLVKEEELFLPKYIAELKDDFKEISDWVQPYILPKDYLYFLEFFGGIFLKHRQFNLFLNGIGPMVEEWYISLRGDGIYSVPSRDGFLQIGSLNFKERRNEIYPRIIFFLDLAGNTKQNQIIGVGPFLEYNVGVVEILSNLTLYSKMWKPLAASFTGLLELILQTKGLLGYSLKELK